MDDRGTKDDRAGQMNPIAVEMPDAVYIYPNSSHHFWHEREDWAATKFVRADLYADQARELVERLDGCGGYECSETDFNHVTTWDKGKCVPDGIVDDVLAFVRSIAETKP
jgi:hypothetical protein